MTVHALSLFFALTAAWAQEPLYPQRGPVEITVLFPAGTSADVTARMLADGMAKALGQRVLVVNRPGAGGAIGYKHVASQKADGYALVWNSNSISTTYHSGQMPFDYQAFDAVARVLVESPVVDWGAASSRNSAVPEALRTVPAPMPVWNPTIAVDVLSRALMA